MAIPLTIGYKKDRLNWALEQVTWSTKEWAKEFFLMKQSSIWMIRMALHVVDMAFLKYRAFFLVIRMEAVALWFGARFVGFSVSKLAIRIGNQCIQHYIMTMEKYLIPFTEEHQSSR